MTEEANPNQSERTLLQATEELFAFFSKMKRDYRLQESTLLDLFRIQLMWTEQANASRSQQQLIDAVAAEDKEAAQND